MKRVHVAVAICSLGLAASSASAATVTTAGSPIGGGQLSGGTTFTIGSLAPDNTAAGNNSLNQFPQSGGENPPNSIDGVAGSKYLNFGKLNTGYIVTPTGGLSNVTGLNLGTGNDSPNRDPATFTLYGSNSATASATAGTTYDLTSFTLITSGNAVPLADPGRNTAVAPITFANAANYTTYLLVFPTVRDATTANSMQIGEAVLTGTFVPEPTGLALLILAAAGPLARRRRR